MLICVYFLYLFIFFLFVLFLFFGNFWIFLEISGGIKIFGRGCFLDLTVNSSDKNYVDELKAGEKVLKKKKSSWNLQVHCRKGLLEVTFKCQLCLIKQQNVYDWTPSVFGVLLFQRFSASNTISAFVCSLVILYFRFFFMHTVSLLCFLLSLRSFFLALGQKYFPSFCQNFLSPP